MGFVGFATTEQLLTEGFDVIGIDLFSNKSSNSMYKEMELARNANFQLIKQDVLSVKLEQLPEEIHHVIYCLPPELVNEGQSLTKSNHTLSKAMDICNQKNASLIFISSLEIFNGNKEEIIDEDTLPNPNNMTGWGILKEEQWIKQEAIKRKIPYVIMRFPHLYGPWKQQLEDDEGNDQFLGELLFIRDAAKCVYHILNEKIRNETIHVTKEQKEDWVKVCRFFNMKEEKSLENNRQFSNEKLKKVVRYTPNTDIESGFKQLKKHDLYVKKLKKLNLF